MASYKFQDSENVALTCKPGDYVFEIVEMSFGASPRGDDQIELKILIESERVSVFETLTLSDKAGWKIDTLLKCCGVQIPKGADVEFDPEQFGKGRHDVQLIGLRGWASFFEDEYKGKKKMKAGVFYTNKPKLARREVPIVQKSKEDCPF